MIRPTIDALPASRIREVANAGIGRSDILKFWFGEGDQVTPAFIRDAAKSALDAGETFYNHNLGLIELREALAAYANRLHAPAERIDVESHCRHQCRRACAFADRSGADRSRRSRRYRHAGVAEPDRDAAHHERRCRIGFIDMPQWRVVARLAAASRRGNSEHADRAGELAEQSDRLDDAADATGISCSRIAAGTASGSSATMRTSASCSSRR